MQAWSEFTSNSDMEPDRRQPRLLQQYSRRTEMEGGSWNRCGSQPGIMVIKTTCRLLPDQDPGTYFSRSEAEPRILTRRS